jgi:hypothetical protein
LCWFRFCGVCLEDVLISYKDSIRPSDIKVHDEYTISLLRSIAEARACVHRLANGEQDVERNLVSFEVDGSLPHHGSEETQPDEVDVVLAAQC